MKEYDERDYAAVRNAIGGFRGEASTITKVSKGKPAYVVDKGGHKVRFDILGLGDKTHERQRIAIENGSDIFPEFSITKFNDHILKISTWAEGDYFSDLHEKGKLELNILEKLGEQLAQLNNITNEDGWNLHNDDITMRNMLWDGEKAVVFDMDRLWWEEHVDNSYVKILLKRLIKRPYIDAFLKGYAKHRDVSNMSQLCAQRNWRWKR